MKLLPRLLLAFTLSCLIIFSAGTVFGSDETSSPFNFRALFSESGFITGFGSGSIREGDYQTILAVWHLGINLDRIFPSLKKQKGTLNFILEPQVNPVVNPESDFEFGLGLGLQYQYPLTDALSVYALATTGPHYISVVTDDEANGFVFANTLGAGIYYHLTNRSAINVGYRFRHISNGGLASPNDGINSNFGIIGYSVFFK